MKTIFSLALFLFLFSVLPTADSRLFSASGASASQNNRIKFQILAIEENPTERKILSETTIEGPPGTDFNINLQTGRFKMQARFLSDLIAPDALKVRAKLNTRRLYGYSASNLPLYEEDAQNHTLNMGFDENIVLLPFGRGSGAETLKIEITPTLLQSASGAAEPLKINFVKQLQSGEIAVEASKIPHRFEVEAILLADGREIARGAAENLLEEPQAIVLQPHDEAKIPPLTVKLSVDKYTRSRPSDRVSINFDFYRANEQSADKKETLITKGAGVASLGGAIGYRLDESFLSDGRKYELKFKIRLATGERAD